MTTPPQLSKRDRLIGDVFAEFVLFFARSFYWHTGAQDQNRFMKGGTAFVLKFGERHIAVTANHVLQQYLDAKAENPKIVCQMHTGRVHPELSIIAQSTQLDLATFEVSSLEVPTFCGNIMDCTNEWPPPKIKQGDAMSAAGYPENLRREVASGHFEFGAWGALCIADDVTDREILTVYDPSQINGPPLWAPLKPPLGVNLSGCSGGPVILHRLVKGIQRFFPVGIIAGGPTGHAPEEEQVGDRSKMGDMADHDRIFIRRLDFMNEDGTFNEPSSGWLP